MKITITFLILFCLLAAPVCAGGPEYYYKA